MAEFHGYIQSGKFNLPPIQQQLRQQFLAGLKDGARIRETLTREGRAKTVQQVRTIFGLAVEMVRQRLIDMGCDICGVPPNKDMVYDILKKACFGVGDMGETLGLSEMTTMQAMTAFENCRTWSATQLQLVIPDPDIHWQSKKVEAKNV